MAGFLPVEGPTSTAGPGGVQWVRGHWRGPPWPNEPLVTLGDRGRCRSADAKDQLRALRVARAGRIPRNVMPSGVRSFRSGAFATWAPPLALAAGLTALITF